MSGPYERHEWFAYWMPVLAVMAIAGIAFGISTWLDSRAQREPDVIEINSGRGRIVYEGEGSSIPLSSLLVGDNTKFHGLHIERGEEMKGITFTISMRGFPEDLKKQVEDLADSMKETGGPLNSRAKVVRRAIERYFHYEGPARDEKRREEEILEKQENNPVAEAAETDGGDLW
jgi:hypothetical protein